MLDYLQKLLGAKGLAPHGYCLLWDPALIWTHVISDLLIGVSYFSIPIALATFLTRRRDVQFGWIVWMFAAFIMACGTTHFFSIWTLWHPDYGAEALVKLFTAIVSVITAVALWPLLPRAIAVPSPAQLRLVNTELTARVQERDEALAALSRETAERVRTEELLRQSQKMEAVGQLTGGIAHDFNNLLTVVIANIERVRRLAVDEKLHRPLDNALQGAERAATLTDQLLAFSRKQPLQPKVQDLGGIVLAMQDMIEQAIGPKVTLRLDLAADLPPVAVDTNQAQSMILNLAINARDAMPAGGTLTIRTSAAEREDAAPAVLLEVGDTGTGMAAEVRDRAFEPFYTTKPLGEGTGLGLSQVYGFTKQSDGDISIRSEEGAGTTIALVLPAVHDGRAG